MIRRTLAAGAAISVTAALLMPWGTAAQAADTSPRDLKPATASPSQAGQKGTVLDLGTGTRPQTYIVQLDSPAIPTRELAVEKGATTQRAEGAAAYGRKLKAEQADLTASIGKITGGAPQVLDTFTHAINGITVKLTRSQAQRVARIDGVKAVQVDFTRQLNTDVGPEWIGAPSLWDGSNVPGGVGSEGEGVIVGILDTGLNPANPSFADSVPPSAGGDGYDHTNPFGAGNYVGVCDADPTWGCNDKVIGYWNFSGTDRYDDDGHGSHTASTTAGNRVDASVFAAKGTTHEFSVTRNIKGVAPHANIIGYDVCDGTGCQGSSITDAIEQAIIDGVDVINYSIGASTASNPWSDPDAVGFLNARAAGIYVATSAGNDGPGAATLGSPADVPWVTSVGATTHNRKYVSSVTDITDGEDTLPDIAGAGLSGPTDGPFQLVYAGDAPYNNPRCSQPDDETPVGAFPVPTDLTGLIVVCDRGGNGRVEKGENLAELGAEGMVLANDVTSGDSLSGDAHALPAAHITYDDGVALKAFMASHPGAEAALTGSTIDEDPSNGDIMAAFSSRGPNRAVSAIGPSVSAPGVDILAAAGTDNDTEWEFISGTSMASPHTAGAFALLKAVQPDWTPAEAQSALMTTAERDITDSDGTVADWFDMGSGRIELRRAARAGLVLDENLTGYEGADPAAGGDVRTLNMASMADDECLQTCSWTRTFTGTSTGVGTWDVSVEDLSEGITLSVDKSTVQVTDGGSVDVTVTATLDDGLPTDEWLFGTLVLTPQGESSTPVAHLPVGVLPSVGVLPEAIDITTRRDAGSQLATDLEAKEITDLQIVPSGLVPEESTSLSITEDGTNTDAFNGDGTAVTNLEVPAGATSLIARLANPTAPDFDLYVGTGAVTEANVVAQSAAGGSNEAVEIANPEAGTYWVLVQNWEASTPGGTDTTDLVTAVVAGDQGNLRAEGPTGPVPAATPFDIRTFWDESDMDAGENWHGTLTLGSGPGSEGDIGVIPVTIHRVDDDVTKSADKTQAAPGDVITYTVDVAPNVTPEDLNYTITDTLPEGSTYVDGSATNGASYEDGVVSWTGKLESTFGDEGNYTITTSAQDPSCQTPFGPGYLDLAGEGIDPDDSIGVSPTTTDTVTFSAFAAGNFGFYGQNYQGLTFSDDGFLVYGDDNYDPDGEPWVAQSVPDATLPNSVAALMWQDMEFRYDAETGAGVTLASTGTDDDDVAIVEYDDMRYFEDDAGEIGQLDMQVFATVGSNDLVFAYDNIDGGLLLGGDASVGNVTVGTENATASQAATLVNQGNANGVLSNGLNVCATYAEPTAEASSFSYQVKVNDTVGNKDLTNRVVHTTDDPGAKPASAKYTVAIKGSAQRTSVALSLNPDSIDTGDTTAATATVFTTGATPAIGQVQFFAGTRLAGTGTLDATGKATATLSGFTTAGTIPVTAKYLGDGSNGTSTSAPVNLVVAGPNTPTGKLTPKIGTKMVKPVEVGKKVKLRVTVRARDIVPSGTVKIVLKGAGKNKTWTKTLNAKGRTKVWLPKFRQTGKVKIVVSYLGDSATEARDKTVKFRVVDRRTVR
ncbi:S8 family serine peptidase [Nocardioides sp.]|uniref:S8 family serine peptidase n=1 Tax=Nocardioides sp. TaxID=35761 RepID=UPI002601E55E|nr:S8 family serine peptidase [Nocardioides sp.]MCW2736582.1 hypothetical protein [Nocardioides sp.]